MAHWISGLIGPTGPMEKIAQECDLTRRFELAQGFSLILIADEDVERLAGDFERQGDEDDGIFDYMHPAWLKLLSSLSKGTAFAYVETRYFGGTGGQGSALFQDGRLSAPPAYQPTHATELTWPINAALSKLGVQRDGAYDEFEAIGLNLHRS
jgi:hypothetical protein